MANSEPTTKRPMGLADAFNFVNEACKRCNNLSMDEGIVLNSALQLLRRTVEQRLAADKLVHETLTEQAGAPKKPVKRAVKKTAKKG